MKMHLLMAAAGGLFAGAILGIFITVATFGAALDDRIREISFEAFDMILRLRRMIKRDINPYGKPFEGTAYDFGIYLIEKIDAALPSYIREKVEEQDHGQE